MEHTETSSGAEGAVETTAAEAPAVKQRGTWMPWAIGLLALLVAMLLNNTVGVNAQLAELSQAVEKPKRSLYEQPANLGTLISRVQQSVVTVECGDWAGTGWAISLEAPADPDEAEIAADFPFSVVTNEHVISDCADSPYDVQILVDGKRYDAYLYNWDVKRDIALISVSEDLPTLDVGPEPQPGHWVMTVGNPFDTEHTVSIGNVMNIDGIDLVNSAPINNGNSGGPLVNARGQVIGITTSILTASEDDPLDIAQDWNIATTIPAMCKEIIECEGDPLWTWAG